MITIYGKPACPQCDQAKSIMNMKGLEYDYIDISVDESSRQKVLSDGFRSAPAIYIDDEKLGGVNELIKWLSNK